MSPRPGDCRWLRGEGKVAQNDRHVVARL
jgi:hypothetical protein